MEKAYRIIIICLSLTGLALGSFIYNITHNNQPSNQCSASFHYSYFSSKSFFDDAYKNISQNISIKIPEHKEIKGVLVNHHLLASNLIAETITQIATMTPLTVILVSPNHFSLGQGKIISSVYRWDTPYGILESDCEVIYKLQKRGVVSISELQFGKEHGISGIVSFIKKSLPNAKVVPIIVKDSLSEEELNQFIDVMYEITGNSGVIIGSYDFSHNVLPSVAQIQDKKSLEIIKNMDVAQIKKVAVDSKPGLEIVIKYLKKIGANKFTLMANTNSGEILHLPDLKETTSYIDGFFTEE